MYYANTLPLVRLIHISATVICKVNAIQKAMPKNCRTVKPVKLLVAKNRIIMGLVVATAKPIARARIIHLRCRVISLLMTCKYALVSEKRNSTPYTVTASVSVMPPMAIMKPITKAVVPMIKPEISTI